MAFLLPHNFKRAGIFMTPAGFFLWMLMQRGYVVKFSGFLFSTTSADLHRSFNVAVAVISFFCFITGMYFLSFSKEKIEDELVQKIRLDSFQWAALIQLIVLILGFAGMAVKEPGKEGMLMFFVFLIFVFWLIYLIRFNYILHFRFRNS